jgi:tRNA threonylcarbamoyladenosine biosynthesis protein TsaB
MMSRGHAEHLMLMVQEVLAEARVAFSDLDLLAVTIGPGGFTGLRVGIAAAQGISLAGELSCIGVSTLEVVANGISFTEREDSYVLAAIDSKREDIYTQIFVNIPEGSNLQSLGKSEAVLPKNLAKFLRLSLSDAGSLLKKIFVVGDASEKAIEALRGAGIDAIAGTTTSATDARGVAAIAANRWAEGSSGEALHPLYLRLPDATVPRNGGQLRP